MALHIIKLVVGCDTIDELLDWRSSNPSPDWRVHTRQTPKRAEEVLDGGSIYRVFKGLILCRQKILGIETVGEGQQARCQIVVSPEIVRVAPTPRRAFQGWRYFRADEAPPDLDTAETGDMPSELAARLREAGAW
jgi:hypothetical protein